MPAATMPQQQQQKHSLERSFDTTELKKMLVNSQMVVDRPHSTSAGGHRRRDFMITRPPLPKGSDIFEQVLGEFHMEGIGMARPEIRVIRPSVSGPRRDEKNVHKGPNGDYCLLHPKGGHRGGRFRSNSIVHNGSGVDFSRLRPYSPRSCSNSVVKADLKSGRSRSNSIVDLEPKSGRSRSNSIVKMSPEGDVCRLRPKSARSRSNSIVKSDETSGRSRSSSVVKSDPRSGRSRSNSIVDPDPKSGKSRSNSIVGLDPKSGRSRSNSIVNLDPKSSRSRSNSIVNLDPQSQRSRSNSIVKTNPDGDPVLLRPTSGRSRSNSIVKRDSKSGGC
ncbi:hypothetical protein BaRGS_00026479 [Batillaria attramentaria]|uniref:Uncharacterized protein n=1 Tax=Batillaria attramentaria TaxID=370345 RepID=A0ABD0K5Z6_9CAEN